MTIWITRDTAGSVLSGGLERVHVHFRKPVYLLELITERDNPFGFYSESHGYYKKFGWHTEGMPVLSVGKWIGYAEDDNPEKELALFIWNEVHKHFHDEPIDNWPLVEREGRAKIEDFLLEIEIQLSICSKVNSSEKEQSY
jgi:hypothetical protein